MLWKLAKSQLVELTICQKIGPSNEYYTEFAICQINFFTKFTFRQNSRYIKISVYWIHNSSHYQKIANPEGLG